MSRELAAYVRVSRKGDRDFDKTLTQEIQLQAMSAYVNSRADLSLLPTPFDKDLDRPAPDFDPAKRPDYARAKAWVAEQPTKRGMIVYNASRFGRNDWSMVEVNEFHKAGALLVLADSGQTSDLLDTADGYFALLIAFGLASTERRRISDGWKKTVAERARLGLHHGKVPIGYYRVPKKLPNGSDNPEAGQLLFSEDAGAARQIFVDYSNGVSVRQLAKRLAEIRGVDNVEPSTVKHMMKNEVFTGKIRRKDTFVEGAHEALVSPEVWAGVQRRNRQETKQSSQLAEPRSFLSGLLRCGECGGSVVTVNQKGRGTFVSCRNNRSIPAGAANRCKGFGTPLLKTVEADFLHFCGDMPSEEHLHVAEGQDERRTLSDRLLAAEDEQRKAVAGRDRLSVQFAKGNLSESAFESGIAALEEEISQGAELIKVLKDDLSLLPAEPVDRLDAGRNIVDAVNDRSTSEARHIIRQELETFSIMRVTNGHWRYLPKWIGQWSPTQG